MIEIELKEAEVTFALDRLLASLTDLTPVMQEIGEFAVASAEARYDQGIAPDGTAWLAKSINTIAAYEAGDDPVDYRPLFKTGTMRRTMAYEAGPTFMAYGSNRIQAAVMQFGAAKGAFGTASNGSSLPWGDIPARPFIGLSDADRTGIVDIVEEWLEASAEG